MSRRFLYSRSRVGVIIFALHLLQFLCVLSSSVLQSAAQGKPELKRPQDNPEDRTVEPPKKKKQKGPRAVGILQTSGGKTTLIPVAILVDGKFHDASVYKAEPVPMALEGGTVYEVEQSGESQGLFTVNGALHSKSPGSQTPWMATGSYLPQGAEAPRTSRKAEDVPVGMDNSGDEPPRLTRGKAGAGSKSSGDKSGTGSPGGNAAPEKAGSAPVGTSGQDASKQDASKTASSPVSDGGGGQAKPQSEQKPTEQKPTDEKSTEQKAGDQKKPADSKSGDSAPENYYRPTLRRGKPTQAAPEEVETPVKVSAHGAPSVEAGSANGVVAQLAPAISDAGGPDPQSYKFFWKEGEEQERRQQMIALAADEVRAYVNAREKGAIPAKTAIAKVGVSHRKTAAKAPQPEFENIQFRAFDLWKNYQPVMVFTAEAHLPPTTGSTAPETYSITLAARTDIYGNLRKLHSGVTDKFHLDVTPQLDLIDAVDADGDGRGELLFRETADGASGYVIYRATGDKLWKMFDSLAE